MDFHTADGIVNVSEPHLLVSRVSFFLDSGRSTSCPQPFPGTQPCRIIGHQGNVLLLPTPLWTYHEPWKCIDLLPAQLLNPIANRTGHGPFPPKKSDAWDAYHRRLASSHTIDQRNASPTKIFHPSSFTEISPHHSTANST